MTTNSSASNSRDSGNAIIITTAKGMVPSLLTELGELGMTVNGSTETGAHVTGTIYDAMRLNLCLRSAHRVLWRLSQASARNPDDLYKRLVSIPWERWISEKGYVCVTTSGQNIGGNDPRFVSLKTKDAIVDRINNTKGSRPDSGPDRGKSVVHIHWEQQFFDIYLDTSGEPLSHRGYRLNPYKAPMRETLAATCLLASHWNTSEALVNPMCGSGTLAIEAALMASHTPAGWLRRNFGFMHILGYDEAGWHDIRNEASRDRLVRPRKVRIFASDHDPSAIRAAKENAERAGIASWIDFSVCDFRKVNLPEPPGLIIYNPEYGERIGDNSKLQSEYKAVGDFMKQHAQGYTGAVFTGNADLIKAVGLKPKKRIQLFNGPIECRLLVYELYSGTKRDRRLRGGGSGKPVANNPDQDNRAK